MKTPIAYDGAELDAMRWAKRYHRAILRHFAPYLGRRVVEVGAGIGNFAEAILSPTCVFAVARDGLGSLDSPDVVSLATLGERTPDALT